MTVYTDKNIDSDELLKYFKITEKNINEPKIIYKIKK